MQRGFTIVELIIVITVISILATIITVSYNGVQQKAHDAAVQSDLDSIAGLLEAHRVNVSSSQQFPGTTAELGALDIRVSKKSYDVSVANNLVYCVKTTGYQSFALAGLSRSGAVFLITQNGFAATPLTKGNFANATALCTSLGLSLVSSGMNPAGTWQAWARGG